MSKAWYIAVVGAFLAGLGLGLWSGAKAWREGCTVEVNLGAKFLKTDCSARRAEGTLVEFVSPTEPLPLGAALTRVAQMTEDKDPQRVFVEPAVLNENFAQQKVTPPGGRQASLAIIRQLLTDAGALNKVDICVVQGGYRLKLARAAETQ